VKDIEAKWQEMPKLQLQRWDTEATVPMHQSNALGARLLKSGRFGADLIKFPPGGRVGTHTHPGQHILIVVSGDGWVTVCFDDYRGRYPLQTGVCYLIPGNVPHAIDAETELAIISVADDHRDVEAKERLDLNS
jgi:quercetin dioxygenase-like cupin family protein